MRNLSTNGGGASGGSRNGKRGSHVSHNSQIMKKEDEAMTCK